MNPHRGHHEGSFSERGDKIRVQLTVHGQRLSHTSSTRAEARAWVRKTMSDVDKGLLPADGGKTLLGDFLNHWLETMAPSLRPKTLDQYSGAIRLHLNPDLGQIKLRDLRADHLQVYVAHKLTSLASRTVQIHVGLLRHALADAVRWRVVSRNVAMDVTMPRSLKTEMRVWSPGQVRLFMSAVAGDRREALYRVALSCGLRLGELLGLSWDDVDLEAGRLQVRRIIQRVGKGSGLIVGEPKTAKGRRSIALPATVVDSLRHWKVRQLEERLIAGRRWRDSGYVFTSEIGTASEPRRVQQGFTLKVGVSGVPRIRFHDLRHSCATLLLGEGIHPKVVQEMLGHSTIAMTLDLYSHVLPHMQTEAAKAIDRVFAG